MLATCLLSCAPGAGGGRPSPSPASPPSEASTQSLLPYYGSYSTDAGDILVIARLGWFFDLKTSAYRTIYATSAPARFTIGTRFREPLPKFADLVFASGTLTIAESVRTRTARRIGLRHTDVTIPALNAQLAATITEPEGAGPHPGIVVVHGAERGERYFYDIWVGVYASLGLAVLTYDKRGVGSSTGTYPGEFPTVEALNVYADDASAALSFLAFWPGMDPRRVGFHGGSQGGWTVPLAIRRHQDGAFAVLASAPATTVDQTDLWVHGNPTIGTLSLSGLVAAHEQVSIQGSVAIDGYIVAQGATSNSGLVLADALSGSTTITATCGLISPPLADQLRIISWGQ